jgi:hypothetical protein
MKICYFWISIVKAKENWLLVLNSSGRRGLLALDSNGKSIHGPREESCNTLPQNSVNTCLLLSHIVFWNHFFVTLCIYVCNSEWAYSNIHPLHPVHSRHRHNDYSSDKLGEEERKYSSYSFLTSALYGWVASVTPRRKDPLYPLDRRLGGPQRRSGHRD